MPEFRRHHRDGTVDIVSWEVPGHMIELYEKEKDIVISDMMADPVFGKNGNWRCEFTVIYGVKKDGDRLRLVGSNIPHAYQ